MHSTVVVAIVYVCEYTYLFVRHFVQFAQRKINELKERIKKSVRSEHSTKKEEFDSNHQQAINKERQKKLGRTTTMKK